MLHSKSQSPPSVEKTIEGAELSRKQSLDKRLAVVLDTMLAIIHVIGKRVFGPLWMSFFESVQDAITLGLLVKIPSLLSEWVLEQKFSGMNACWIQYDIWHTSRYACYAVVLSDYALWAVLIPRILLRCFRDLRKLSVRRET